MGVANLAATIHRKVAKSRRRQSRFALTSQVEYKLQPERKKVPQKRNIRAERRYQMIPSFTLHTHSSFWEIQLGDGPGGKKKERFLVSQRVCVCLMTTHDSFHPSNGPVAPSLSINKEQQSLFALSSSLSRFKILFSPTPDSLHPITSSYHSPLILHQPCKCRKTCAGNSQLTETSQ